MIKKNRGKQASPVCRFCHHHPTKRLYVKKSNAFKGFAWFCVKCDKITAIDE